MNCIIEFFIKIWKSIIHFIDPPQKRIIFIGDSKAGVSTIISSFAPLADVPEDTHTQTKYNPCTYIEYNEVVLQKIFLYNNVIDPNNFKTTNIKGLVFVLAANEIERGCNWLKESILPSILQKIPKDTAMLIFINKADLCKVKIEQVKKLLNMNEYSKNWFIQPCVATKGYGLYEGFDWLFSKIVESK